jgi:Kef-type K+ transport system membrane component KefB/mannitol/fructose-specific phosphotransferase system IIA component (Ntr-type)
MNTNNTIAVDCGSKPDFMHLPSTRLLKTVFLLLVLLLLPTMLFAAGGGHDDESMTHKMMLLVIQIGVVLFAGYVGLKIARKFRFPGILGEVAAGIIIGPFLLGSLPLPGFSSGLFPVASGALGISPELFGFASVGSIVLLFLSGLQTDLQLFLRYALRGTLVGLSGGILSIIAGTVLGVFALGHGGFEPRSIFLGVVAIATSVDITARILNDRRKMASAEGVTILSASVIEDVLGITLLAVLLGLDSFQAFTVIPWGQIFSIGGRAIGVWLAFTGFGILFSHKISKLFKYEANHSQLAVLALGLALIISGVFETFGLALIVGAYVTGLSLSNTDIAYVIQEKIEPVHQFFDPIFFTVIGMLVNLQVIFSWEVFSLGILFGVLATFTKLLGCGLPALAVGFTPMGALRIALGMVPRGEVALIMAGIGLSSGILDDNLFGIVILMTLITTMVAPPLFNRVLKSVTPSTKKQYEDEELISTEFTFDSPAIVEFLLQDIIPTIQQEGFFIHVAELEHRIYHMRKDTVYMSLMVQKTGMSFSSRKEDTTFIKNLVYEGILSLQSKVDYLQKISKPVKLREDLVGKENRNFVDWNKYLFVESITLELKAQDKQAAIEELVDLLAKAGRLHNKQTVLDAVLAREKSMSTGMKNGIAIPHGRSEGAQGLCVAIGIKKEGIDFATLDGKPAKVIFLIVSPERDPGPHLQILSGFAGTLNSLEAVETLVVSPTKADVISYFVKNSNRT